MNSLEGKGGKREFQLRKKCRHINFMCFDSLFLRYLYCSIYEKSYYSRSHFYVWFWYVQANRTGKLPTQNAFTVITWRTDWNHLNHFTFLLQFFLCPFPTSSLFLAFRPSILHKLLFVLHSTLKHIRTHTFWKLIKSTHTFIQSD